MKMDKILNDCLRARQQTFSFLMNKQPINGEEFYDQLIDYLSLGHFQIYERLLEISREKDWVGHLSVLRQAHVLLAKITEMTQAILDQYDAYQELTAKEKSILSKTAELLSARSDYEDQLLKALSEIQSIPLEESA